MLRSSVTVVTVGLLVLTCQTPGIFAQKPPLSDAQATAVAEVDNRAEEIKAVNKAIWDLAEVGLQEHKSSALLIDKLPAGGRKGGDRKA